MNKKGFLLGEHTLKIIIAVICIILLLALLFGLYSVFIKNKRLREAETSLKNIEIGLKEAESKGEAEVIILYPAGSGILATQQGDFWWLVAWPSKGVIPKTCKNKGWDKCLCICSSNFLPGVDGAASECDKLGVCTELTYEVQNTDDKTKSTIQKIRDWYNIWLSPKPIAFYNPPIELKIKYMENKFEITREK